MTKEEQIIEYAKQMFQQLEETGVHLSDEEKMYLVEPFLKEEGPIEEITTKLLEKAQKFKADHDKILAEQAEPIQGLEFYQLPDMYHGITLNEQDIDLLNIVGAQTPEELMIVARTLTNIPTVLTDVTPENLEEKKQDLFQAYLDKLEYKRDFFKNKGLSLRKKLDALYESGYLTEEEQTIVEGIVKQGGTHSEIIARLGEAFPQDRVHEMIRIIRDRVPIEKSGVKDSTYEQYVNLYNQLGKFNSVTLDDQFKYGGVMLQDGTMDFRHFEKGLRFAEKHGLQVRGNSLISYMCCPDEIYAADKTPEMHDKAYQELDKYIKGMFSLLSRPEYQGRVRSIDIFNELLTRKGPNYQFRGDAPQDVPPRDFDDNNAGWYKHLSLEDIFELIAKNKHLLEGKVDFMYNEVFLEDPAKMEAFHNIMGRLKQFEQQHGVQLIDTLGIQLHTDISITKEQLAFMFREMAKYGYPIEITEFDMMIPKDKTIGLTEQQIERMRQRKINEILRVINYLKDECNIKGFTIWSLTDTHNFEVSLENEQRIPNGEPEIKTLHAGYFTEDMTPRGERVELGYQMEEEQKQQEQQPELEQDKPKTLKYTPPKPKLDDQGFASILVIAIVVGSFLGMLLAFALLNIK